MGDDVVVERGQSAWSMDATYRTISKLIADQGDTPERIVLRPSILGEQNCLRGAVSAANDHQRGVFLEQRPRPSTGEPEIVGVVDLP